MRIYPAPHYTMGGLWVDYNLMSNVPGLFVIGEANFSDHGANRLGASALMQGLADGYFVLPYTIGDFLAQSSHKKIDPGAAECTAVEDEVAQRTERLLNCKGKRTADHFHRELGKIVWESCGMSRNAAALERGIGQIAELREQFWNDVLVPGNAADYNQALEAAGRVADFFELGELMCRDALERDESCGAHFREEHQTGEGEAARDDERFSHAAIWEYTGEGGTPVRHEEQLTFEYVKPAQRSYK
jgi:succinate dehydrogenase / fumarate reductase flavoprotein subunit